MDPQLRRWWRDLEAVPGRLGVVHAWRRPQRPSGLWDYHCTPTLVACLSGAVRVDGPDHRVDLHAGDVLLLDAGVMHRHAPVRQDAAWFGHGFMAAWSDVLFRGERRLWCGRLPMQPSRRMLDAAVAEADSARRRGLVAALLGHVLDETIEQIDLAASHGALGRMLHVLWRRLHEGVTSADLVRASGLSRSQAWAVFQRGYGVTPRQAILKGRLWLSERLLADGLAVGEVAARCGWPSPAGFSRAWKRVHGVSPRGGRRRRRPGGAAPQAPDRVAPGG